MKDFLDDTLVVALGIVVTVIIILGLSVIWRWVELLSKAIF